MGNEINLKTGDGLEPNFFTKCRQYPITKSLQEEVTFDLNLRTYRWSKFQISPFYQHFLGDTSFVNFDYKQSNLFEC